MNLLFIETTGFTESIVDLLPDQAYGRLQQQLMMDDLENTPQRSLDFFESAGLQKLQSGKDLFVRNEKETIRMLGAVRAQKQCLSCHDVAVGRLLGAFSYTLRIARYEGQYFVDQLPKGAKEGVVEGK